SARSSITPPPPPDISTLSLHDALPILAPRRMSARLRWFSGNDSGPRISGTSRDAGPRNHDAMAAPVIYGRAGMSRSAPSKRSRRSEEHTSELQSRENLVCRLLLEKKNK